MWNRRPKPGEDVDDLLKMQDEFLREKQLNKNLQPAAQVTNLRESQARPIKRTISDDAGTIKPSKYALSRGLSISSGNTSQVKSTTIVGDILEKNFDITSEEKEPNFDDDKVYFPKVMPSLIGSVVEKNYEYCTSDPVIMPPQGFPVVTKRKHDPKIIIGKKSIYAQNMEKVKLLKKSNEMEIDEPCSSTQTTELNLPEKSFILATKDADQIHTENVNLLNKMSAKEILDEQQKLLSSLDPKLIKFIKSKRAYSSTTADNEKTKKQVSFKVEKIEDISELQTAPFDDDALWDNDVLSHPNVDSWLHFDSLEKDKLEWMKGIEESNMVQADEPYEARFDFKGYLLPYTIEYTEKTKSLFHHGDEPHRPGYSLTELFELTRSTVTQQRVVALNTIAGILEYFSAGTYKDIIDIPVSKIFFVIRFALDENKANILEPALKAMRNLVYNRIEEASLDALIGFKEGTIQPCLENDKSEIMDLESKESELKDFHLAEIDIIAALIRTDIIQRIYYILDTIRPSFNSVQYCLQILTRLARDSVETALKIVESDHLMNTIVTNFVPTTSINFFFNPELVYNGKPIFAALKLLRILSLQSKEISSILISKYEILTPISEYISSGIDGTYGLRIQIEAICILSNFLTFGIGPEKAMSLCPVIVTALYKHVQGTDIFFHSSVISAMHAAVVLQLINKIMSDNFKHQVYPLLLEGTKKWLGQLSACEVYTCAHLRLISSVLDCCQTMVLQEGPLKPLNDFLKSFASSKGYRSIIQQVIPSSNLLSEIDSKSLHLVKNLMSLGSSVIDSAQKVLPLLNAVSPLPFLASLFNLLKQMDETDISLKFIENMAEYLKKLAQKSPSLSDNWFTRTETDLVFILIQLLIKQNIDETHKDVIYAVANKLCYILRTDKKRELYFLFNSILFNKDWFTIERLAFSQLSDLDGFNIASIEDIKLCYSKVLHLEEIPVKSPNVVLRVWREPILPRDWIYLPILHLYSRSQEMAVLKPQTWPPTPVTPESPLVTREKEFIISSNLVWILFNEHCFPEVLRDIDLTDRFCRVMCVFLCDNSLFLNAKIKGLLQRSVQTLFKKEKAAPFNFNKELIGLHNFQDFYTQLLEQFQSVSYGDSTFSACLLVPLAQKHDVKWRKLLWSEYAGCLRALDCPEDQLCYDLKDYMYPEETEDSLIKSYFQALSSNLLRHGTIAHQIAAHHVECYKKRIVNK